MTKTQFQAWRSGVTVCANIALLAIGFCFATLAGAQTANPAVTQATLHETICHRGWSASVRPSWAYTSRVKHRMCVAQGMKRCAPGLILDHIVPIEVGGAPGDIANMQLQTLADSSVKDGLENQARRDVCAHRVTLIEAQARFGRLPR